MNFARQLETELTAVTEQLKEAQEEIVKLTKGWADCVLKRSKAEEQRDRLANALQDAMEHIPSTMQKSAIEALAAVKGGADE